MTSPLQLSFGVDCPADHAFSVWTSGIGMWWPADHTTTGSPETVVIEGRVGGRIYERTRDGAEHEWGVVTRWDPPHALTFTWHLGRAPSDATEVAVHFISEDATHTRLEIEHSGWERLVDDASARERTYANWGHVVDQFAQFASSGRAF